MTVALLSMLGAALLALVGLVERRQARFEDRVTSAIGGFEDRVTSALGGFEARTTDAMGGMSGRLDRMSDRLDAVAEGQARLEGQVATLNREVGQILSHVLGREARS